MYLQKLNLRQLNKTTIGKRWIKIHAPKEAKTINKWLGGGGLLVIITVISLFTVYKYCPNCVEHLVKLLPQHENTACQTGEHQLPDSCPQLVDNVQVPQINTPVQLPKENVQAPQIDTPVQQSQISSEATTNIIQQPPKETITTPQTEPALIHFKQLPPKLPSIVKEVTKTPQKLEILPNEVVKTPSKSAIAKLLQQCKAHFKANRLTTGKGNTAFKCYHQVLAQEANNIQAKQGIIEIEARYQHWAERALTRGKLHSARKYINQLQKVNPKASQLVKLKRNLQAQSLKQRTKVSKRRSKPLAKTQRSKKVSKQRSKANKTQRSKKVSKRRSKSLINTKHAKKVSKSRSKKSRSRSKNISKKPQPRSRPKKRKNQRSSLRSSQCSNILSQESLGIKPLNQKQKTFKQRHCGLPRKR